MLGLGLGFALESYKPHLWMTLTELSLAGFMILVQSIVSKGISALVLVVYEHFLATLVLSSIAFFTEKGTRPPISFQILCWAFLLGLLEITLCQMLLTVSLKFIAATYQSIALNLITAMVFALSVLFRQEEFQYGNVSGQAKLCGVAISAGGAMAMVLWTGPEVLKTTAGFDGFQAISGSVIGGIMIVLALFSTTSWNLLVGFAMSRYPPFSLSALMTLFGTIQVGIVAAFFESKASSWKIGANGELEILAIFFGGVIVTGLTYCAQIWCIHKKGPVFTTAFHPLLIVFSFLLETILLKKAAHLGSIVGAVLVVGGLYLLLWGKAKESERKNLEYGSINSPLVIT